MKKILVPCDFSPSSKEAFRFAIQLAERAQAEVYVLKVTELPVIYEPGFGIPEYGFDQSLMQELAEDARHKLEDLEKVCGVSNAHVHLLNENGPVNATIREVSDNHQMDLIVMGTHPLDSWFESVLGTHTRKIVRSAQTPVLAVKKCVTLESIKDIVFPTLLATERESVVQKICDLQKLFDATLHILFVNTPDDFHNDVTIRRSMDAFVKKYSFERFTKNIYNDETSAKGIINFATERHADLIAMGTHGRRGFAPLFTHSVVEDVLDGSDTLLWSYAIS
jgi:nucleotide-binding universal stress UspA family protein